MLRLDFAEIFDYVTRTCVSYSLNSNGTLITPAVARLMTRPGIKMISLYGATAEVHDRVTRHPGSFEATMRGFAYLKEADAGFTVQIVPMRENFHQYDDMVRLAQSLSPHYRVGAAWLYLSACRSEARNREIVRQRLDPVTVITLDRPDPDDHSDRYLTQGNTGMDDRLFAACIANRCQFHLDPYGFMSFCSFIKDPALRYDVRQGNVQQAWDEFIPSLADRVHGGQEYVENCGSCELRADCRWCAVYGYLEHGRYSAKVDYLCQVAQEARRFKVNWTSQHTRYYQVAGITVRLTADAPITDQTFDPKFKQFQVDRPGADTISIRHHFSLPDLTNAKLGREVYHQAPWAIYRQENAWLYLGISPDESDRMLHQVAIFSEDYSCAHIYNPDDTVFRRGVLQSLTMFPTDQIWLARILADRQACFLHSSGVILHGRGLLFVGHSEAGKSTIVKLVEQRGEILCDDRNIVRRWPHGFRIHGTWSHGEVPVVSAASAPLRAILFLEKAGHNHLIPIDDRKEIVHRLLPCIIKPLVTADWWDKTLDVAERIAAEVPAYRLQFDRSGRVVDVLEGFVS